MTELEELEKILKERIEACDFALSVKRRRSLKNEILHIRGTYVSILNEVNRIKEKRSN